jgi:pimeloyl-ACP methyl ester carboxylesterase
MNAPSIGDCHRTVGAAPTRLSAAIAEAPSATPALPAALDGSRIDIDSPAGRLSFYTTRPFRSASNSEADATPLLMLHSINASGSAFEVKPIYERCARARPVVALDLPGFGSSERSDRPYTPRLMTDAVLAVASDMRRRFGNVPIDLLGVSLSCEYVARAASEQPTWFRSVALVSPTGFNRGAPFEGPPGSTRGIEWLRKLLMNPRWGGSIFRQLTRPGVIRFFLKKTWGSPQINEGLMAYDVITTRQPGAEFAPLWFVSAFLFSADISRVYQSLELPVWMVHGTKGDFVDYRDKARYAARANWSFDVMQTGALPYFEQIEDFMSLYDGFLDERCRATSPRA